MKSPDDIKKGLADNVAVHYHPGDLEPRLTPLTMVDLEELHADALALIQQKEQENAEQAERIRQLEQSLSFACDLADGLKAATVKQEQELYVSVERNRQLQADLEDMTARYKIADECAKKKGEMNEKLYAELTAVKAERDAALENIRGDCVYCLHLCEDMVAPSCFDCANKGYYRWEWRGVPKENGNEST